MLTPTPRETRIASLACLAGLVALTGCDGGPAGPGSGPASIAVVAGADQRAVAGLRLLDPVVIRVLNQAGGPVAGQHVTFTPGPGSGGPSQSSVTTGQDGEVATSWTLGASPGTQTLTVATGDLTTEVRATAIDIDAELEMLFQPPRATEILAVKTDWAARSPAAQDVAVEFEETISLGGGSAGSLRIVSHTLDGGTHYGAVLVPEAVGDRQVPVLVYLHGGDGGVGLSELQLAGANIGAIRDSFVYVIPSFRGESFSYGGQVWTSTAQQSPWDRDVDDSIALLDAAIQLAPQASPTDINLLGFSRGAGVALLWGAREDRVARIAAFFGPTNFFDPWVKEIVRQTALRNPPPVVGIPALDTLIIQPYIRGDISTAETRIELVRRSGFLFAQDLPQVQLHHGTADFVVPVSQAYALIDAMDELGRGVPDFEAFIYQDGGHDPFSLVDALPRTVDFLSRAFQ